MKGLWNFHTCNFIHALIFLVHYYQLATCFSMEEVPAAQNYYKFIRMPSVSPTKKDDYLCTGITLNTSKEEWVLRYDPLASANIAHHMLLYGCSSISSDLLKGKVWDCGHHGVCGGGRIMYAWAKNAPAANLPENVGFKIGGKSGIAYLTLQIHYANVLPEGTTDMSGLKLTVTLNPQMYKAGIYLLAAGFVDIPPLTPITHADINCKIGDSEKTDINIFGFRVHAHQLGSVITGYKYEPEKDKLTEIVKGNPQWPQAFYPLDSILNVKPQDVLHARCTYNSSSRSRHTYIGSTSDDEMCNLYLMYYTDREVGSEYGVCGGQSFPNLTARIPESSDDPLPHNSLLEEMTEGDNRNKDKEISYNGIFSSNKNTSEFHRTFDAKKALAAYSLKSTVDSESTSNVYHKNFRMPGVSPSQPDAYLCTAMKLNETQEQWILQYKPIASANRAHHMLLFGCSDVDKDLFNKGHWDCGHHGVCAGGKIMYAWAKNAPATHLPDNVGFRVGGTSDVKYLTLQIHYATSLPPEIKDNSGLEMTITTERQMYKAGIYLLAAGYVDIPPHSEKTHADMNCKVGDSQPVDINIFAFRVHAHKYGTVITGYKYNPENYELIEFAKGNPQWPQAFYPLQTTLHVSPQELLHARCTFNASTSNEHTYIGGTAKDEMCNLYLMYYTDAEKGSEYGGCGFESFSTLTAALPPSSDQPLPPNPELEEMTHGENKNLEKEISYNVLFNGEKPIAVDKKTQSRKDPLPEDEKFKLKPKPVEAYDYYPKETTDTGKIKYFGNDGKMTGDSAVPERNQETLISQSRQGKKLAIGPGYELVDNWGPLNYHLGQVTAVAVDSRGDLVLFHRGQRTWDGSTFKLNNVLVDQSSPILQATLLHIQRDNGQVMHEWGANFFFMPHGLFLDQGDNLWLTDVGMHQVFKFPSGYGDGKPLITLGVKFEPGNDDNHFCKPSAVAVMKNNEFFVSDGYCNSRIIHFSPNGQIIKQFGTQSQTYLGFNIGTPAEGTFNVPHALALVEDKKEICVADRENGRVQCFKTDSGKFQRLFKLDEWGSRLFSIAYTPHYGGILFAVNGPQFLAQSKIQAYEVNYTDGTLLASFSPYNQGFSNPHDITISKDGQELFISEIGPNKIWKYILQTRSKNEKAGDTHERRNLEVRTGQLQEVVSKVKEDPLFSGSWSSMGILSVVLGLIAVPVIVLSTLTLIVRCKSSGSRNRYLDDNKLLNVFNGRRKGKGQTLGSLLHNHHGFEKVATNDIDDDDLDSADSDVEEFSLAATKV